MTVAIVWPSPMILPTTFCVPWKCWTMTATWSGKRICSPSVPFGRHRWSLLWTPLPKPWLFPSLNEPEWICPTWRSSPAKRRMNLHPNCEELSSVFPTGAAQRTIPGLLPQTSIYLAMSVKSSQRREKPPKPPRNCTVTMWLRWKLHSRKTWKRRKLMSALAQHGLTRSTSRSSWRIC